MMVDSEKQNNCNNQMREGKEEMNRTDTKINKKKLASFEQYITDNNYLTSDSEKMGHVGQFFKKEGFEKQVNIVIRNREFIKCLGHFKGRLFFLAEKFQNKIKVKVQFFWQSLERTSI